MNKRFLGVLIFAFVVAFAASYLVYQLIVGRITSMAKTEPVKILVAARDLPVGTLIKETDVTEAEWGGKVSDKWIQDRSQIVGRGVLADILEGEPFAESRLAPKGAGAGLAAIIPEGKRAVAVRVNEVIGVGGFAVPGMRVDVLASGTPPDPRLRRYGPQTRTILQNIEVLSAGHKIEKDPEGNPVSVPVVNLLVTPEEAEILSLAASEADIQLVLRNPLDRKKEEPPGTALAYLFGERPKPQPKAPARRRAAPRKPSPPPMEEVIVPVKMQILHGAKREDVTVGQKKELRPKKEAKR